MTRKSNRRKPPRNQDVSIYISPFQTKQTLGKNDFLVGLFDGHGTEGHVVANYAAKTVPTLLASKLDQMGGAVSDDDIVQALNQSFLETDAKAPPAAAINGGCTGSVTLRRGSKLYVANTGDSRTAVVALGEKGEIDIPYMTILDKAHRPEERARIERMGGTIKQPPKNPLASRVWVRSSVTHRQMGLAMSRSLGDWEWGTVGVTAEPRIDVLRIKNFTKPFLIAASDGMWDAGQPQFLPNTLPRI